MGNGMNTGRLDGRRILITGAGSGIGKATAAMVVAEGGKVALLDRDLDKIQEIAKEVGGIALGCDVTREADVVEAVARASQELGGLDGIVNSAGISQHGGRTLLETTLDKWNQVMAVNLTGAFLICREAVPHLKAVKGSSIVNVSSGAGLLPSPAGPTYGASKAGLIMFSKFIAQELGPEIRVNAIAPGAIDTPMLQALREEYGSSTSSLKPALQRTGRAEEIAAAIVFLLSDDASYVTGSTLTVDGGRSYH